MRTARSRVWAQVLIIERWSFLRGTGLTSDQPTAEDLVEFNTNNFNWTDVRDLAEVEVFGGLAIRVRFTNPEGGEGIQ